MRVAIGPMRLEDLPQIHAIELASQNPIEGIVGATYPLRRWREAIDHALGAGKLGTLRVAFDPRAD